MAIATSFMRSMCADQELTCTFRLSRLDFGGVTIVDLKVNGANSSVYPLTADRISVDLAWSSPLGARADWIGGDNVALRVDLRGGPVLGDLDRVLQSLPKADPDKPASPMPRILLNDVRLIAETALGPVEARGRLAARSTSEFTLAMAAQPAKLASGGAELDLAAAEISATASGDVIKAAVNIDLARFAAPGASIADVKINLSVDQLNGLMKATGAASANEVALAEGGIRQASAQADLESEAVDLATLKPEAFITSIRKLTLTGSTGAGSMSGAGWEKGVVSANLAPRASGGASGEVKFVVDRLKHSTGTADRFEVDGQLDLPSGISSASGRALNAVGTARLKGATLAARTSGDIGEAVESPLKGLLPQFAAAAARTVKKAGEKFELVLPWSFRMDDGGFDASALTGVQMKAASGFAAALDGGAGKAVFTYAAREAPGWAAAGALRVSGGGGPQLAVNLVKASGGGAALAASGNGEIKPWTVAGDTVSGRLSGLAFETGEAGGSAAGDVVLSLTGGMAGGAWKDARAAGAMTAVWSPETFVAEAPKGLSVSWSEAAYGETKVGAGALKYAPKGKFAEKRGGVIVGAGTIAELRTPISGSSFSAQTQLGATAVMWTAGDVIRINFDAAPTMVTLKQDEKSTPVSVADIKGSVELDKGWRLKGAFSGGALTADQLAVKDLAGGFDLGGQGDRLSGQLSDVSLVISDPHPEETRMFETARFDGSARLKDEVADFTGVLAMVKSGVQIATVNGRHSLETGSGALTYEPTPLIFRPRSFEPSDLSPLLRGPANVTGRIDVSGAATWDGEGLRASATANLRKLGFALASAGVFEGVSGKIEVADLVKMTSAPGQTITIDKVTLGMPIETGTIRFQLIGYDAIRLESAEWPFAAGKIRVQPLDFAFGADSNRIVAEAVDWDLTTIIEMFKVPDVKVNGQVSGQFPVVFSTGSARVDKALLQASSKGGVIQYTGSTGDAAAQADSNAKMLFDALRDFRYEVLRLGLDGDLAGKMVLSLTLQGRNPDLLGGAPFDLNISIDSALMDLLNTTSRGTPEVNAVIDAITGGRN